MGGVGLLDQKTAAYQLDRKSFGGRYYRRLFFDLMDISVVNSHVIYKVLYPKRVELVDFKIVLAKSLIGTYNCRSWNTPASHVSRREVLPAVVPLQFSVLQTTKGKCRYCSTGGIEDKKSIVIRLELSCAWFQATDPETVFEISIPKFNDNKYFFCCCSYISSLSFTLGYLVNILFIWVRNSLMKI